MSTPTYQVRVQSLRSGRGKTTCVLEILTLPAVDTDSVCTSRSFVLCALFEATHDASPCPLAAILNAQKQENFLVAPEWYRANLDRFVLSTKLVSRKNHDVDLRARWEEIDHKKPAARLAAAWKTAHTYRLEVVLASPDWVAHLQEGTEWETTADDWWSDDPASAPRPAPASAPTAPAKPPSPTARTDLRRVLAGLAHIQKNGALTFQGSAKVVSVYQRALRFDPAEPLEAAVEHARLRLLNDQVCRERREAMAGLARFWVELGGPGFFLEVLATKLGPVLVVGASMPGSTWRIPAEKGSNLQLWQPEFKKELARLLAQLPALLVGPVRERATKLAGKDPAAAMTVRTLFPA